MVLGKCTGKHVRRAPRALLSDPWSNVPRSRRQPIQAASKFSVIDRLQRPRAHAALWRVPRPTPRMASMGAEVRGCVRGLEVSRSERGFARGSSTP